MGKMILKNIKKIYGDKEILSDINIKIDDGEFVVLIGESGCGKSTLLRMICGLETISKGDLIIDGKKNNEISPQKRNIAMVFQSYALYPHLNVYENIAYGLKILKMPKAKIKEKVEKVTQLLNINQHLNRLPKTLSGGQRQRVAMGRCIVREPNFFLFDEPLSNLDAKLRVVMRKEIKSLQKKLKTTTIYVTHDQIEAMTMADKIVLMDKGKIVQIGTPEDLFDRPNSIFTASFLGSPNISLLKGSIEIENNIPVFYTYDKIRFAINPLLGLKDGQKVILGIRPRDFCLTDDKSKSKVRVHMHEYTGAENIIYGEIGENKVNIAFSRQEKFKIQEELFVTYAVEKTHIFCANSKKNLK